MGNETKVEFGGKVNSSFGGSIDRVKKGVQEVGKEIAVLGIEVAQEAGKHTAMHKAMEVAWSGISFVARRGLASILPGVASVLSGLALIVASGKILSATMWLIDKATGAVNAGLSKFGATEEITSRLKRVTGSVESAKAKLGELAGTFKGTNVSLPDAADAYKNSEVLTGGALSDKKGMTMLGDVAASSGNGIKETSLAVGKFYDDLQSGRPIEDTAKKLEDMGVISGDVHSQITNMLKDGKSGVEVWEMLTGEFAKSSGAMAEARDNLNSLQKGLQETKDKLLEVFAAESAPQAKDALKAQTAALEDLQPAVEEAGSLFAQLKATVGDTSTSLNQLYDWTLKNVGSLKAWVDVLFVGGVALAGFAVGVPVAAVAMGTLAAGALAAGGVVVATVGAVAAGLVVWTNHINQANERQLAMMHGTDELAASLKSQREGIGSVTDKAVALAHAYDVLKKAKEAFANAKDPKERDEMELRVGVASRAVARLEQVDDSTLTASDPRAKSEKDLADLQAKDGFEHLDDAGKRDVLGKRYSDAVDKGWDLQGKMVDAEAAAQPQPGGEVDAERAGATARAENARAAFAAQAVEVEKAREAYEAQKKIADEKERAQKARLGELEVERRVAGLQTEGLTRAQQEWAIKRQALVTEMQTAEAAKDVVKAAEARTKIVAGDAQYRQQLKAATAQKEGIETEMKIAALQTEGADRIQQESALRLALIEARWKEAAAAKDTAKIDEEKLAYYQEQVRAAKELTAAKQAEAERATALQAATSERTDNQNKREADAALAQGKITPEQRRALDIDELRKKQKQANDEATQLEKQSRDEANAGRDKRSGELAVDAVKKRQQADTFGFDADALSRGPSFLRPVADNLARIGGGGNVGLADPGKELGNRLDRQTAILNQTLDVLKQIKDARPGVKSGRGFFG